MLTFLQPISLDLVKMQLVPECQSIIEKTTGRILTGQLARYTSAVVPVKWQIKFIKDLALTIKTWLYLPQNWMQRMGKSDVSYTIFSGNEDTISLNIIAIASCNFDKSLSLFDNIDVVAVST